MASFQQRGKTWQYTISRGKEKPIRKGGFRTKKEAQVAAAEMEDKINKGIVPHLKPAPIDEYFKNWVELYKKNISKATKKHYKYTYDRIKEYFGSKPLQEISKDDYQMFLNQLGDNKSKETVEKVNGHIRACIENAVDNQILSMNFTKNTVLHYTVKAKKNNEKHLNFHDSKKLLRELIKRLDQGKVYYLLLLGLVSGLRFEELVGLTFEDFDFENKKIKVNKVWGYNNRMKKGFGDTKNKEERTVTLDSKTMDIFKSLIESLPDNDNHLIFYNPNSKYKVITNETANDSLKEVLLYLNIRPLISVHGLRHTHGSILIYQKATPQYVKERLGHEDIQTTLRKYIHLIKELKEEDEKLALNTIEGMYY